MPKELNYLDLFSGIGGFAAGIERAGLKIKNHFFSEIEKNAIKIYEKHFPHAKGVGDVAAIRDVSQFGKIDIITFGFPCQDLSLAGKRHGLKGARSGLFFEAIRLVRELRPAYFIFENVKGIFSSDGGADFIRCLQEIADIGIYDCEWQLVNTSWLLPQNRERIYFIGHLRGTSRPKVFPFTESDFKNSVISGQNSNAITTRSGTNTTVGSYVIESQFYEKTKRNPQRERIAGLSVSENGIRPFQGDAKKSSLSEFGTIHFQDVKACSCLIAAHPPKIINKSKDRHGIYDGYAIRRLTPLECERLQGFPDGWTEGLSDSARYKALGNAVTVDIVEMIVRRLFGNMAANTNTETLTKSA